MTTPARIRNDKLVLVCDKCLRASCWYGEFMCDDARTAGLVAATIAQLKRLGHEHPDYWTNRKFEQVYGDPHPDFSASPRYEPRP